MEKVVNTTVYRSAVQDFSLPFTKEEERSKALRQSPEFVAVQKQVEKEIRSLSYSQPQLTDSERLQLAVKVVLGKQPKPISKTTNKDYIQEV